LYVKKLVEVGVESLNDGTRVLEAEKIECRIKRSNPDGDNENKIFNGFDYRILFRIKHPE
jgi:hypothetical protein